MTRASHTGRAPDGGCPDTAPPSVAALRCDWQFAAVCQFLFTFEDALGLDGFQTDVRQCAAPWAHAQRLEAALGLAHADDVFDIVCTLLRFLTHERSISAANWEGHLRWQWNVRHDSDAVLGTPEQPVGWPSLALADRVRVLHALCEWQLEYPERLRRLVSSDEDAVSWRVNPAGWDREGNTYWLFDAGIVLVYTNNRLWIQRPAPRRAKKRPALPARRQRKAAKPSRPQKPAPRAGRRSARLSNGAEEPAKAPIRPEDVFGSDSELSQLSADEDAADGGAVGRDGAHQGGTYENAPNEDGDASKWVEFETICISRDQWVAFAERFADSKHPDEKSLHQYIAKEVLPRVLEVFAAVERKAVLEQALSNRKRSSRIAMKESEREEHSRELAQITAQRAQAAAALAAENERQMRDAAESVARQSRGDRLREREERLFARERERGERQRRRTSADVSQADTPPAPVHADDWHLRCEVCGVDQANPPDSTEVAACEQCGSWQHTACWDAQDAREGRTARDWDADGFQGGTDDAADPRSSCVNTAHAY
ncbi:DNA-directed RNA polymerase [Malassezia sp. CBS 17886]|nr:DNA-directed RNA polymerase [Malassezia sp. CBS 17886]